MPTVQFVGPEGEQHHQSLLPEAASQERDERPCRTVGPVKILKHERHRLGFAQAVQQLEQRFEQAELTDAVPSDHRACTTVIQRRDERRQLGAAPRGQRGQCGVSLSDEWPDRSEQRRVRKLGVTLLDRFSTQDECILARQSAFKFGNEASLSDP